MRSQYVWLCLVFSFSAFGAEISFNFDELPINEQPAGFTNVLYGKGAPGDWKIIMDDVPPLIAPATPQSPVVTRRPVLAQLSHSPTDEHFPLLLYEKETFGDFTLTTRFKIVDGVMEQLAGIVFRVQDETNFYVIRANAVDNTLRFYKVVNGLRGPMLGPKLQVPANVWHELKIDCKGNQIRAWFNGQEAIPMMTDSTFATGKIGYWTKSDAVSYFSGTTITYVPREPLAQVLVRAAQKKYPRLLGLKISMPEEGGALRVVASKIATEVGTPGGEWEKEALAKGAIFTGHTKTAFTVIIPLRDHNGDPVAAVTVVLKPFSGQTEDNAVMRALPIVREMQKSVQSRADLIE